jgi:phospholipid transport system transporter-binding protein
VSATVTSQLADRGQGRCVLSGALTLPNLPWLWKELETTGLLAGAREVDLSGVQEADSAGLALLMAWKAYCLKQGGDLAFHAVPQKLLALAKLTGAETALAAAG